MSVRIYASEAPEDVKQRHKLSYNALAATYNMWTTKQDHRRLKYLDELFARVPKLTDHSQAPVVLELGCGAGVPTLQNVLCRNNALTAKANDISDAQLDLARSHLAAYSDRVQFHCGDMMEVECEDGSLTAAIALYSIIHLPRDEQSEMVSKIARWLEPGGCFLGNFGAVGKLGEVTENWLSQEQGWKFVSSYGADGIIKRLKDAGLEVEMQATHTDPSEDFIWVIARKSQQYSSLGLNQYAGRALLCYMNSVLHAHG